MNKKRILVKIFSELSSLLKCKYSLIESLVYLEKSKSHGKTLCKYVGKIKENLGFGFDIYSAFELSGFEKEIYKYKNFIKHQEMDFQLQKNLEYIVANENQKKEIKDNLSSICVYPLFIFLASIILAFYLLDNKENFMLISLADKTVDLDVGIYKAIGFLLIYSFCFLLLIYVLLKENFQKNFFYSIHFLLEQDFTLFDSIKIILVGEKKQKNLCLIQKIIKQLEEGEEIFQTFKNMRIFDKSQLEILEKSKWNKNYKEIFADYFNLEKIKEKKKVEKIQKYSESLLLFGLGIFLVILIQNTILPFLTF